MDMSYSQVQTDNRDVGGCGGGVEGRGEGRVAVWRGKIFSEYSVCVFFCPLVHTCTSTEAGFFLRGRCRRTPVCSVGRLLCGWMVGWMDVWMEDRAKRRRRPTGQSEQENSSNFHSFRGCLQCRSLRGAKQTFKNKKKGYYMSIFLLWGRLGWRRGGGRGGVLKML